MGGVNYIQRTITRKIVDFSTETMKARRQINVLFEILEEQHKWKKKIKQNLLTQNPISYENIFFKNKDKKS